MKKIFLLVVIIIVLRYGYKFYLSTSAAQSEAAKRKAEDDKLLNQQYLDRTKPKEYADWEYKVNKVFDPGNLFGFR